MQEVQYPPLTGDVDELTESVRTRSIMARNYTDLRNEAIREAHTHGASLRRIARAAQLSHTAIKKIIDKADR